MPTRMIREGMLDSEPLAEAGDLAEVLFTRLMLVADDCGRFDGRVTVICRRCWPLGGPDEGDVAIRLAKLVSVGLIVLYEVGGKPFISIPKFGQRLRNHNSKYPEPPPDDGQPSAERPSIDRQPPDTRRPEVEVKRGGSEEEGKNLKIKQQLSATPPDSAGALGAAALESLKAKPEPMTLGEARLEGVDAASLRGMLFAVCIANGVTATPAHPLLVDWARDGITVERLKHAIATARMRKPLPQKIPVNYVETILKDTTKPTDNRWATDDNAAIAKGRELGIEPKRGEDFPAFRGRIREAMQERARSQVQ